MTPWKGRFLLETITFRPMLNSRVAIIIHTEIMHYVSVCWLDSLPTRIPKPFANGGCLETVCVFLPKFFKIHHAWPLASAPWCPRQSPKPVVDLGPRYSIWAKSPQPGTWLSCSQSWSIVLCMFFLLHNLQQVNKHTKDAQPEWELEQHATPQKSKRQVNETSSFVTFVFLRSRSWE